MHHSESIILRTASHLDAPLVYALMNETMHQFIVEAWGAWDEVRMRDLAIQACSSSTVKVVLVGNTEVGVLHFDRLPTHFQVHQIYFWPQFQKQGIGEFLIKNIIAEASHRMVPVRLRVLLTNPAKAFYEKLGFVVTKANSECFYMERVP